MDWGVTSKDMGAKRKPGLAKNEPGCGHPSLAAFIKRPQAGIGREHY
jgi:hypothetical protein